MYPMKDQKLNHIMIIMFIILNIMEIEMMDIITQISMENMALVVVHIVLIKNNI